MKRAFSFAIIFFLVGIIVVGLGGLYIYNSDKETLFRETMETMGNIAEEKAGRINGYLSRVKGDILVLQESGEVKDLLSRELVSKRVLSDGSFIAGKQIEKRAKEIIEDIEAYLILHPNNTLKDLQDSNEFGEIAVQQVGGTGYSAVTDCETLVNRFHPNPNVVDLDLHVLSEKLPGFWSIMGKTEGCNVSEGFYDWEESDGRITQKYMYIGIVNVKTSDGVGFSVAATTYINDYKIVENVSLESDRYLKDFKEESDYYNLALISPDGYIVYMAEEIEEFGTNLEWTVNLGSGLSENYFEVKGSNELSFSGPFIGEYGDIYPKVSVMVPVYENRILLGYVGLIDEIDKIFAISREVVNVLSETEESYLVSDENLLLSPLRLKNFDIFVQSVRTKEVERCFGEFGSGEKFLDYLDYWGEVVIGASEVIVDLNSCLIVKMHESEAVDVPLREKTMRNLYIYLGIVLALTFVGFFVGRHFDKERINK